MIIINPIFEKDPNKPLKFSFKFPTPKIKIDEYDWEFNTPIFIDGTSGTNSQQIIYPDLTEPNFPGFEDRFGGTFGTSGVSINYFSEVLRLESQVFQPSQGFRNIKHFTELFEEVEGDTDLLEFVREFRFSTDNSTWSKWKKLTIDNINSHLEYFEPIIYLQFKYDAVDLKDDNFNQSILIDKPDEMGWFPIYNNGDIFKFKKDYPEFGEIKYKVKFGKEGDYFLNTETNKLYGPKKDGKWGAPIVWQKSNNIYTPSWVTDEIIDNSLKGDFIPSDDIILSSNDIRFGKTFETSSFKIPEKEDSIFINSIFQNLSLNGVEKLEIIYEPRTLPENYKPRLYIKELTFFYELEEVQKPLACLDNVGDKIILKSPFIIKAYEIEDFILDATGLSDKKYLEVYFRWSNNSRNWSKWEFLTKDNLKCLDIDPLSFFYIEFMLIRGGEEGGQICICDLILTGDYENVDDNYNKLGRFGLRSDCNYGLDTNGEDSVIYDPNSIPDEWKEDNDKCDSNSTFNPYDFNRSLALYEKLADDVNNLFSWEVEYYKTDADISGKDYVIHEYQLYNVIDKKDVKVMVPENQFPDNTVLFNQFDLSLFDTFEIHITRKEFHRKFGIEKKPQKRDFLFFCQTNRMYQIEHAQKYKEFMNSSIYYKVVLKKYQDRKNIDNRDYKDPLNDLLKDNSMDNLFQDLTNEDIDKVSHKEIQENLTEKEYESLEPEIDKDIIIEKGEEPKPVDNPKPIHLKINSKVERKNLQNGPNLISKSRYDLSNTINKNSVVYQKLDNSIKKGKNRSFSCWFNIQKYVPGQKYNLINNFNSLIRNGYKINFVDGSLVINWFNQIFEIEVSIKEKCWYGIVINFNQRQEKIELYLYTISSDKFSNSTELELIKEWNSTLNPIEFNGDLTLKLKGSNMLWTNMRIFKEIIPKDKLQLVLNQYIVEDTSKLLVADNCTNRIISPNHKF